MRGYYGKQRPAIVKVSSAPSTMDTVGQALFHSVTDRERAIEQLGVGIHALIAELLRWHEGLHDPRADHAAMQWVQVDVLPAVREWDTFAEREKSSWAVKFATSWQTFVDWHDRLKNLRQLARAYGIQLQSPEPPPLPQTIWEKSEDGRGNDVAPWFGIAKIAIGAAVTLTGAIAFYSVVREWTRPRHAPHHLHPTHPLARKD